VQPIATERLVIRPFTMDDLDDFLAYQSDPEVRRHLKGDPQTPDAAADYLASQSTLDDELRDAWHDYAIEHRALGQVIGNIGVYLPASDPTEADLGFQLHPRFHGHGYAREAARGFIDRFMVDGPLTRLTASCAEPNERSAQLLIALGMTEAPEAPVGDRSFELRR
jgi:ribosomal-protein-alanine N-acetyltransferase